jgi:hypothetical protein
MPASPNTPGNAFGSPLFFKTEEELLSANLPAGITAYAFNTGKFYNRSNSSWSGVVDSQSLGEPLQDLPGLRAVPPDARSDKQVRLVEDSKAQYFFDSTGTGPDNGDTVIVPDVGTGAWFKIGGDGDVQLDGDNVWTGANVFVNPVVVGDVGPALAGQALAVNSTTGAFVLPRMNTTERDLLNSPVDGSMIYNSQVTAVQIRDSGQWITVSDAAGLLPLNNIWTGTNEFQQSVTVTGSIEGLTIRQNANAPLLSAEAGFPIVLQNDFAIGDDVYIKMKCGDAGNAGIKWEDTGGFTALEYLFNNNQFRIRINNFAVIRAQQYGVGIGIGGTPVAGQTLSVDGTSGSFKVPNMTETERDNLPNQVNGCILYNDSTGSFNFYEGGSWIGLGADILGAVNTWTAQNTFTGGFKVFGTTALFQESGSLGLALPETVILAERSATSGTSAAIEILSGNAATTKLVFSDTDTQNAANITFDHSFFKQLNFSVGGTAKMTMNASGVVIGSSQPIAGEALAVDSTTGTFMVPRMTSTNRDDLIAPSDGAVIYNTTDSKFNLREGGAWVGLGQDVLGSINVWTAQNTFTGGFSVTGTTAIFQKTGTTGTVNNDVVILAERSSSQFQAAAIQIMSGSGNLAKLIFSDSNTPESASITMDNSFFNQMSLRIGTTPRIILNSGGVVIGNSQPSSGQALSVISTTGTFLPPRMSNTDRANLTVTTDASIIYNTSSSKFNFYENGAWKQLDSLLGTTNLWTGTNQFTQTFDVINTQGVKFSKGGGTTALGANEIMLCRDINNGTQIKFQCNSSQKCGFQMRDTANAGGSFLYEPISGIFEFETTAGAGADMSLSPSLLDVGVTTGVRIANNPIGPSGFGEQLAIQNSLGNAVIGLQSSDTSSCSMLFGSALSADQVEFTYDNNDGVFRFDFNGFFVSADAGGMHIGDAFMNNDRLLELTSTTSTFVLNRMSTTQRDNLPAGAITAGALIYNNSINKLQFYNGTGWETVTSA